jgi:hypothetical protein
VQHGGADHSALVKGDANEANFVLLTVVALAPPWHRPAFRSTFGNQSNISSERTSNYGHP